MPWMLVLFVAVVVAIVVTTTVMHLALMLLVAGFVGYLAGQLVGDKKSSFGWLGATVVGLVGGWLGQMLIGPVGPSLFGVRLVPALLGAAILAFVARLVSK